MTIAALTIDIQVPTQSPHQTAKGEHTGMILCPYKRSEIAVMRCADYALVCGMALTCTVKPTAKEIGLTCGSMAEELSLDYPKCQCGRRRSHKRTGECDSCYNGRWRKEIITTVKYGLCGCGQIAIFKGSQLCKPCDNERRRRGNR